MAEKTLSEQLAEQIGAGDSKLIPAIFDVLTDENEARLLLAASPPATMQEISEKTGIGADDVEKMIDPLFRKGLLFKSKKTDATRYYRVRHLLQMHDATAVANDPHQRMLDLWKEYMATEWHEFGKKFEKMLPTSVLRVIPVNVTVEANAQILAFEDVRSLIDNAKNLAVTRCSCRVVDGACGQPLEVCIQLDRAADYAIERGTGRQLSREEAMSMLRMCEEEGLIHVAENRKSQGNVICNCCRDCCLNWTSVRTGLGKFVAPSRFRASVDAGDCNGCELCVDACFFDALSMEADDGLARVDADKCMGCGVCQVVCPTEAVHMQVTRPEEFVPA
jgi:formate hydrogenlyase subunit 6/NADH:ubiquinone oxidoreductase subunit I/predicted transcriptional regulator